MTIPDRFKTRNWGIAAALGVFALGCVTGAGAMKGLRPAVAMAPGAPVAISILPGLADPVIGRRIVTVRGAVAEVFGNRFVLADKSGRVLIEAGGRGDTAALVASGQTVTVQGLYANDSLRAAYLVGADGGVTALRGARGGGDHGRWAKR